MRYIIEVIVTNTIAMLESSKASLTQRKIFQQRVLFGLIAELHCNETIASQGNYSVINEEIGE